MPAVRKALVDCRVIRCSGRRDTGRLIVIILPLEALFEGAQAFAQGVAQLRKTPGAPEEQDHDSKKNKMTQAEAEHSDLIVAYPRGQVKG
jgi:hypothetical protein